MAEKNGKFNPHRHFHCSSKVLVNEGRVTKQNPPETQGVNSGAFCPALWKAAKDLAPLVCPQQEESSFRVSSSTVSQPDSTPKIEAASSSRESDADSPLIWSPLPLRHQPEGTLISMVDTNSAGFVSSERQK